MSRFLPALYLGNRNSSNVHMAIRSRLFNSGHALITAKSRFSVTIVLYFANLTLLIYVLSVCRYCLFVTHYHLGGPYFLFSCPLSPAFSFLVNTFLFIPGNLRKTMCAISLSFNKLFIEHLHWLVQCPCSEQK
jgi:hypothetical protein